MMRTMLSWILVAAVFVCAGPVGTAQQDSSPVTVSFSDPTRPGTLRVHVMRGNLVVKGTNRKDVTILSRGRSPQGKRQPDPAAAAGLRRISQGAGFTADQENNVITVRMPMTKSADVDIEVPSRTNLRLSGNHNAITVEGVEGEIEVTNVNAPITLTNVAGSVVANSTHGKIVASVVRVTADKAMGFVSFGGDVDVTLPSSLRANLKLRSDGGDVFTNFDLLSKPAPAVTPDPARSKRGRGSRNEVNTSTYGTVNGGGPEIEIRTFQGNVYVRRGN